MSIVVSCECGRTLRVKDEAAGRKVRCPGCGATVAVAAEYEDVSHAVLSAPLDAPPRKARLTEREGTADDATDDDSRPPSKSDDTPAPSRSLSRPPRRKRPVRRSDYERSGGVSIGIASIITGVMMMLGATIWFIAGLSFGIIFFYPPILFLLGIVAVARGFMGRE